MHHCTRQAHGTPHTTRALGWLRASQRTSSALRSARSTLHSALRSTLSTLRSALCTHCRPHLPPRCTARITHVQARSLSPSPSPPLLLLLLSLVMTWHRYCSSRVDGSAELEAPRTADVSEEARKVSVLGDSNPQELSHSHLLIVKAYRGSHVRMSSWQVGKSRSAAEAAKERSLQARRDAETRTLTLRTPIGKVTSFPPSSPTPHPLHLLFSSHLLTLFSSHLLTSPSSSLTYTPAPLPPLTSSPSPHLHTPPHLFSSSSR